MSIAAVSGLVGRWFALIVVVAGGIALVVPDAFAGGTITVPYLVVLAVVVHNLTGYGVGYAIAKAFRMPTAARRAIAIEVGMQDSGLAAGLATVHFSPAAAPSAAIFSVGHNVSGSLLASYWARRDPRGDGDPRISAAPVQETNR